MPTLVPTEHSLTPPDESAARRAAPAGGDGRQGDSGGQ
jgi:hypothetical protein